MTNTTSFKPETLKLTDIRPHPRNYRTHPKEQLEHLAASIKQNGFYRNIVIAKDGTILAGHGVALACEKLGLKEVPVIRLNISPNSIEALKVVTGDNEISSLGEINDRALTDILKEIGDTDIAALLGTGFDAQTLASLVMVTRPASEIADAKAAAEFAGVLEYEEPVDTFKLSITFKSEAEREEFVSKSGLTDVNQRSTKTWSVSVGANKEEGK